MSLCVVTATLQNVLGEDLQGNAFVRFKLRGFSGGVPRINGTSVIAEINKDVFPDDSGNISTNLWTNDVIIPANSWYTVEFWNSGRIVASGNYIITGATFDLDSQDPVTPPSPSFPFKLVLETDGVMNELQNLLNIKGGLNVTLTAGDDGSVTIDAAGGGGGSSISKVTTAFSSTPTFTPTAQFCIMQITLSGNVASSTFNAASITANAFITLEIIQDATGGRTFVFPTNFLNAGGVGTSAAQTTIQQFYWDGTNAYAVTPPTVYP